MNIFGIGGGEFFVIIILALIVFGPGKLPELMGDAGRMLRELRRSTRDLTSDIQDPMREIQDAYREVQTDMRSTMRQIQSDTKEISDDFNSTITGATEFGKTSSKKRAPSKPAAANNTSAGKASGPLDQQFEEEAVTTTVAEKASPNGISKATATPNAAKPTQKPKPSPNQDDLLAAPDEVDDLLAGGDGADDLLSASEDEESSQSAAD